MPSAATSMLLTDTCSNQRQARLVVFYPCDVPGCTMLATNTRNDYYVDHQIVQHGISLLDISLFQVPPNTQRITRMNDQRAENELNSDDDNRALPEAAADGWSAMVV